MLSHPMKKFSGRKLRFTFRNNLAVVGFFSRMDFCDCVDKVKNLTSKYSGNER